jgi:hypothetical protein
MRPRVRNPFNRASSVRIGRVRIFSIPWYWDVVCHPVFEVWSHRTKAAPSPACDRHWLHDGPDCPLPWIEHTRV